MLLLALALRLCSGWAQAGGGRNLSFRRPDEGVEQDDSADGGAGAGDSGALALGEPAEHVPPELRGQLRPDLLTPLRSDFHQPGSV